MKSRFSVSLGIIAAATAVVSLALTPVAAQSTRTYKAPRTADGHPDMQGVWDFRTVTPLERPAEFAGKEFLTPEEAAALEKKMVALNDADANRSTVTRTTVNGTAETQDVALAYNNFWWDRGTKAVGNMRTSLITEPKDGKLPAQTPEAMKKAAANRAITERPAEGPEDRPLSERCITRSNTGPPMVPAGYNNNFQIFLQDNATAGNAIINNGGDLEFNNTSKVGAATIVNRATIAFQDSSTALSANISNASSGVITFNTNSTGGNANISNDLGGLVG